MLLATSRRIRSGRCSPAPFLSDPQLRLYNNLAEWRPRRVALGRKSHYGLRSKRGTEFAALFYSLFETAKLLDEEPRANLWRASCTALNVPGTIIPPSHPAPEAF